MSNSSRKKYLSRIDFRRRSDHATNSVLLEYVGRGLDFFDRIYGHREGVFFVASVDEMPYPPEVLALSAQLGVPVERTESGRRLKEAAVDALVAEAMVKAPQILAEFAEPGTAWRDWDHRDLERKHSIAVARLIQLIRLTENEIRLRASAPRMDPGEPPRTTVIVHAGGAPELEVRVTEPPAEPEVQAEAPPPPSSVMMAEVAAKRVEEAVAMAREAELAQRLPHGARRRLEKMPRGQYIACGATAPEPRLSLAVAMRDAEHAARGGADAVVIDWDGEWPVVARRYGEGGRVVYRVEEALRRAGIEEKVA